MTMLKAPPLAKPTDLKDAQIQRITSTRLIAEFSGTEFEVEIIGNTHTPHKTISLKIDDITLFYEKEDFERLEGFIKDCREALDG